MATTSPRMPLRRLLTVLAACAGLGGAYALGVSQGTQAGPGSDPDSRRDATSPLGAVTAVNQVSAVNAGLRGSLTSAQDCAEALSWYVDKALAQVGPYGWDGPPVYAMDAVAGAELGSLPQATGSFKSPLSAANSSDTGTNTQEAGVDEPDVAKTDGRIVVRLSRGVLTTYDVAGAEPRELSQLRLAGVSADAQLLLVGQRVVVLSQLRPRDWEHPSTLILTIDLADPKAPVLTDRRSVDASLVTAFQHGSTIRLVVAKGLPQLDFVTPTAQRGVQTAVRRNRQLVKQSTVADWVPQLTTVTGDSSSTTPLVSCDALSRPASDGGLGTLAVITWDPADPEPQASALLTASQIAYASPDHLVVASTGYGAWGWGGDWCCGTPVYGSAGPADGITQLDVFSVEGRATAYVASGQVDGTLRDRWSLDEDQGTLRVALGPSAATGNFNSIETLRIEGDLLVSIDRLERLGPGEDIQSVRWFGDAAILVTFRQIDPLYVVDLSDPAALRLRGKLKIPGFSAYLHPLGPERLIGIGEAGTRRGRTLGAQAALFNLADLEQPRQVATHRFGRRMIALAGQQPHQFTWLPESRTALTVITDGYGARTGWVARLKLVSGKFVTTLTRAGYGRGVDQIRMLPLPSGQVALVTERGVSLLDG